MINKIIHFSVYHRGIVLFSTLVLAVLGWFSFTRLPIDAVPDITNTQVQVFTEAAGLSAEEVERTITFPVENAMAGIAGIEQVRSLSRFGISVVTVVFEEGTDVYRARQMVSERLQMVDEDLPGFADPKLGPITTGLGEIFFYSLESKVPKTGAARMEQLMELRAIQDYFVKPRLLTVPGVAEVNTIGGFEKQFHVLPRPESLAQNGVSFGNLVEALERTNRNVGGGYVQQTGEQFVIQGLGLLDSIDDIKATPLLGSENIMRTVSIRDVADVQVTSGLRSGAAVVGDREAVVGTVFMLLGSNSRDVSARVAQRLEEIKKTLPEDVTVEVLYDRSHLVNQTLGTVEHNLMFGATLVIIVLLVLLGNLRAAVITALVIPLSLLLTFIGMKHFGISGNLLSLGALDFGIIVDGAVIVLDHCVRKLHEVVHSTKRSLTANEVKKVVYEATVEIRTAAGFGEIIVIVVFLPVLGLVGIEGKMFKPMAATFALAVFAALVLSFTAVPAMASILLRGNVSERDPYLMRKAESLYLPLLSLAARFRKMTVLGGLAVIVLGVLLFSRLGGEFLPQMDEASRTFQFVRPVNISLDQSISLQINSQKIIAEFPQISKVFSRIGTAEVATDPMGVNLADTFIEFNDREEWPSGEGAPTTWSQVAKSIADRLEAEVPGQRVLVSQPIQMRFNELLEGTRADVSVKIFGEDFQTLVELGEKVANAVRSVNGAGDVELELQGTSPVLRVAPKSEFLGSLGVPRNQVLDVIEIALGGKEAGYVFEGVRRFPIVVRLKEETRSDLQAIRSLPVEVGARATVPLREAASIEFDESYGTINREQAKRRVAVLINPRGVDMESFVRAAQVEVEKTVQIPAGYYLEWGGNFKNLNEAKSRLMIFTPAALILILAMVFVAFKSIPQTILVFMGVPLALVGGVLGLMLNGLPFSISAGVGFIALAGISVLNGVVLINCFNDLRKQGLRGFELIREGGKQRIRPVLMTALVAIFGFIPMMVSTGVGAEVQRPLASVVVGGLVSATLLTLVVLPILYLMFERYMDAPTNGTSED